MGRNTKRLREAARDYLTDPPLTTMSSKRQITLPAAIVRDLGLKPGVKIAVYVQDDEIVLHPRTKSWLEYVTGGTPTFRTKEEVDEYLRDLRAPDEERARKIEGETYIDTDQG